MTDPHLDRVGNPEAVHRAYLSTDIRPAIGAAAGVIGFFSLPGEEHDEDMADHRCAARAVASPTRYPVPIPVVKRRNPMPGGTGTVSAAGSSSIDAPIWPRQSRLELAPLGTAPSCARGHVRAMLTKWGLSDLASDAQTLVSELAANAVNAARSAGDLRPITVRLLADDRQVLIEVWDHGPGDPAPRRAGHDAESGRGLLIIENFSNRWGFSRTTGYHTKVVWAELLINTR